jgi:phage shock protein A
MRVRFSLLAYLKLLLDNFIQSLTNLTTESNHPNDREGETDRQIRGLSRRVDRLEYAQISPQECSRAFDRVYDEIDALEENMNQRFDRLETRFDEVERKFDIVMRHITGQN